jgi:hypothetical protein
MLMTIWIDYVLFHHKGKFSEKNVISFKSDYPDLDNRLFYALYFHAHNVQGTVP